MKRYLLFLLCMQLGFAETYDLNKIMHAAKNNSALQKALKKRALSREAQNLANTASAPLEVSAMAIRANPDAAANGNEYMAGFSQTIMLGNIQEEQRHINRLGNEAFLLDSQKNLLSYEYGLKNLYHQHCVEYDEYRTLLKNYADMQKLYLKKKKAYLYEEISKTELLQLELQKNRLYSKVQALKMKQGISKQSLLMLSALPNGKNSRLSCSDLYPIRSRVALGETFILSKEAYEKRMQRTHAKLNRYSHAIESIDLSGMYSQELDVDRYGIGVSIPLNFSSKKSEHARAAAMYENSAISLEYEQSMRVRSNKLRELKSQLQSQALLSRTYEKNYWDYVQKLMPLSQKSYDLGETSVIEYLLTQQRAYQLREEMYAVKKEYYKTLFTLYTFSEKKDRK